MIPVAYSTPPSSGTQILSGKPTTKGTFTFTVVAGDGLLPEVFRTFDLTVN
jgi:hypothetical protein